LFSRHIFLIFRD